MAQIVKTGQTINAQVLRDETALKANTKNRVYNLFKDLIDSAVFYDQIVQVTGNSTTHIISQAAISSLLSNSKKTIGFACSDEISPLFSGSSKITFRMPHAMTLTNVRASLVTAQTSGVTLTVDINKNNTSILSTKLTIDNNEKTSTTAAIPAVISTPLLEDDVEITVDIDQISLSTTAKGLKIWLIGY
jgi:hypothetical protein